MLNTANTVITFTHIYIYMYISTKSLIHLILQIILTGVHMQLGHAIHTYMYKDRVNSAHENTNLNSPGKAKGVNDTKIQIYKTTFST